MTLTSNLAICWFKDSRWDKTIYEVNIIRRFGKLGIITRIKEMNNANSRRNIRGIGRTKI